jgi:hypothetical protein
MSGAFTNFRPPFHYFTVRYVECRERTVSGRKKRSRVGSVLHMHHAYCWLYESAMGILRKAFNTSSQAVCRDALNSFAFAQFCAGGG